MTPQAKGTGAGTLDRLIGDVRNLAHLRLTFQRLRPQVVFHAAAYKHVPLMEEHNAWAALRNNTLGTYHAALAAAGRLLDGSARPSRAALLAALPVGAWAECVGQNLITALPAEQRAAITAAWPASSPIRGCCRGGSRGS